MFDLSHAHRRTDVLVNALAFVERSTAAGAKSACRSPQSASLRTV
jgi:hypothetical protein